MTQTRPGWTRAQIADPFGALVFARATGLLRASRCQGM